MSGAEQSLLSHLDAPIVVGDPDGNAVYLNAAFEDRFGNGSLGVPLAELFEGGAREAVLRAVVAVCTQAQTVRFRMREGDVGYSGVASPITAAGDQVGVVILFKEEVEGSERLIAIHREMLSPMEDIGTALESLFEETGGRRNPHHRALVEDAQRAFSRLRKWIEESESIVSGSPAAAAQAFAPSAAIREIARRAGRVSDKIGVSMELLIPATLPELTGDEGRFVEILLRFVDARLQVSAPAERVTLSGRVIGKGEERALLVGVAEHGPGITAPFVDEPVNLEALASLGGELRCVAKSGVGRSSVFCFPL